MEAAWAKPTISVTLAQATVATAADGSARLTPLSADVAVAHGTTIRYTITANNTGSDAARRVTLTGHIPAGTAFKADSLRGTGGHAEYSLDGTTFAAQPMVAKETPNGNVMVPADPALYVMLRWIKDAPLAAAASATFSYEVNVK